MSSREICGRGVALISFGRAQLDVPLSGSKDRRDLEREVSTGSPTDSIFTFTLCVPDSSPLIEPQCLTDMRRLAGSSVARRLGSFVHASDCRVVAWLFGRRCRYSLSPAHAHQIQSTGSGANECVVKKGEMLVKIFSPPQGMWMAAEAARWVATR